MAAAPAPPTISTQPADAEVKLGDDHTLQVSVSGTAPFSYRWCFNGQSISNATASSYKIDNSIESDTGDYFVTVSNSLGMVTSRTARVVIVVPPAITQQPAAQTNFQGSSVVFSVVVTGTGPTYQWKFNGGAISGATNATLVLTNLLGSDAGKYKVEVENMAGRVTSAEIVLTVFVPPTITTQPADGEEKMGDDHTFTVAATGTQPLSYQWFFNGQRISNALATSYKVVNAALTDIGDYYVAVSNIAGVLTSRVAHLEVATTPVIVQQPIPQTAFQGDTVVFSVSANGSPLHFQWKFNGGAIAGGTNGALILPSVQGSQAGKYKVEVENAAGRATSTEVTLAVFVPPTITTQPQDRSVLVGTAVKLQSKATGTSPLNWYWYFNSNFLALTTGDTLDLGNVRMTDEGFYSVIVSNLAGTATSRVTRVVVDAKPAVLVQPQSRTFATGTNAMFTVVASGKPAPTYQWKYETQPVPGATNAQFTIPNVQKSHQGKYRVRIENSYDHADSTEVTLTVLDAPVITQQPQDAFAVAFSTNNPGANSTAAFAVQASGDSLSYQWFRMAYDGVPELIVGATSPGLSIPSVSLGDAGFYWVEISNPVGRILSLAGELSVLGIATQPTNVIAQPGQNITLSVGAEGPALRYQWTRNGDFISGANAATLTITNAQPQDGGRYAVIVFNTWGAIVSVDAVVRITSPALPFANNFADRGILNGLSGIGSTNNSKATREAEDPDIDGVRYNDSVWVSWTAPSNGIVSMSTLGSDFDTLLAVYRGSKLNELIEVATDDESAGFHNSRLLFNVQKGTNYQIRVDSYLKDFAGNIVFVWNLLPTDCLLPLNIVPAGDVTKRPGEPFELCVNFDAYTAPCALSLQWFHDEVAMPDETNRCLSIAAATIDTIGMYSLRMSTRDWEFRVRPSEVQINTEGATSLAHNRLDDARRTPLVGVLIDSGFAGSPAKSAKSIAKVGTPLASGYSGSQIFRTYPGKDPSEPNACGVQGGASYWFTYSPPESGTLRISTDGRYVRHSPGLVHR